MGIFGMIIIGIAAGFIAGKLFKGKGYGLVVNLILGLCGSFIGGWLLAKFGISLGHGMIGSLITATIGAVVLVFIVNLIKGK